MNFEWDRSKSAANLEKHGVSFEEAATAFGDPLSITILDPDSSDDEDRFILIGQAFSGRLLVVVHTDPFRAVPVFQAHLLGLVELMKEVLVILIGQVDGYFDHI